MVADALAPLAPSQVKLTGWLGKRVAANEENRLLAVDLAPLLAGFQRRPGSHPWIGEHIGKWLHAATLAWQNTGDAALKAKLDRAAADLIACQEPDGYLGTYTKDKRFGLYPGADWDVWSHKYCLIGLLAYAEHARNAAALEACRRIGDLLVTTFGPGKKSILAAGTHVGMAATSVLEPMVLLGRATRDRRYLDFCRYIVDSWEEPRGPRVLSTLTATGKVNKTANGKSYEMLSNLVGLCELYRETGERRFLTPALRAWDDVAANQLYLTGTTSYREHFHADHDLPNAPSYNVGETCVTVTWLQLCWQLQRLTGEAKYGHEIERSLYNHLAAAQRPDGSQWCYYTALEGRKPYGPGISCCVSSGPRGMALAPQTACYVDGETLAVNLLDGFEATATVAGSAVRATLSSPFPEGGEVTLSLHPARPAAFAVKVRVPQWVSLDLVKDTRREGDWLLIPARRWKEGDTVRLRYTATRRTIEGEHGNRGRTAYAVGPFVLAETDGREVFFADAGAGGERYRIWRGGPPQPAESVSRSGNEVGSIADGDPLTFTVTFNGTRQREDWYAVTYPSPRTARRITFAHGRCFHDGGWFDASKGKPRIEIKRAASAAWEPAGTLDSYPATTATDPKGLKDGQVFALELPVPPELIAVRVLGAPACGDNPNQTFSSCGELGAF